MSNSSLVVYTLASPNNSGTRTHTIDRISPHCVVGQCSVETLGSLFAQSSRQASSNYGIGADGRVGMFVEEAKRSWCTSSNANDQRAVTIECASDSTAPYAFKDVVYQTLIDLCVDICKRNGKTKLLWFDSKEEALNYEPATDEMVITVHRWFANKSCPGDWLYAKLASLAAEVTSQLGTSTTTTTTETTTETTTSESYLVKVTASALNIRKGPGTSYAITGCIRNKGVYTIVETSGSWGRLKSGVGWIHLGYTTKV